MKEKVKDKPDAYAVLCHSTSDKEKEVIEVKCKVPKRIAKKDVALVNNNTYERLYKKLATK